MFPYRAKVTGFSTIMGTSHGVTSYLGKLYVYRYLAWQHTSIHKVTLYVNPELLPLYKLSKQNT